MSSDELSATSGPLDFPALLCTSDRHSICSVIREALCLCNSHPTSPCPALDQTPPLSISVGGKARWPPRSGLDRSPSLTSAMWTDASNSRWGSLSSTMRPKACGPRSSVGSATCLFSVATTLSVHLGGPLCPSWTCSSSPLLMFFPSLWNDSPCHPVGVLEQVVDNLLFPPSCLRPFVPAKAAGVRMDRSLPIWLQFFAFHSLLARGPHIVERLVRGIRMYAPKVTSLCFQTFLFSKQAFEVDFPNAVDCLTLTRAYHKSTVFLYDHSNRKIPNLFSQPQ